VPIYEYACKECDHVLDALQKLSDDPLVDCPACGEASLRKLLSAPRFRLKGSGWYETDFKNGKQRNVLQADSESSGSKSDSGKSDSGKSDSSKADASKSDGNKSDSGKSDSGKSDNGATKVAAEKKESKPATKADNS
jgi:putative FmdB family regulatory protein